MKMELLFVYGTLCIKDIRNKIAGRDIDCLRSATLAGYRLSSILLDKIKYPVLICDISSKDLIRGELLEVTQNELQLLDEYEGSEYRRMKVTLSDGTQVWAYVQ
jgi:gamma-glutamylcyclotransferase (GGCT)/AIG2-like uncharacterized protein YtfP